jgi:hypothetical protein
MPPESGTSYAAVGDSGGCGVMAGVDIEIRGAVPVSMGSMSP